MQPRHEPLSIAEFEVYGPDATFLTTVPYFDRFGFLHVDVTKKQKLNFGDNLIYGRMKIRARQYWVNPLEKKCYKDIETTATLTVAGEHECEMKTVTMDS
eukprot:sb/3478792/